MKVKKGVNRSRNKYLKKVFKKAKVLKKIKKKDVINPGKKQDDRDKNLNKYEFNYSNKTKIEDSDKTKTKNIIIYRTSFDDLLDLIEQKKIVKLNEVVQKFNIDKKIANEWGNILSENGVINFYAPIFGEPEFRDKNIVNFKKKKFNFKKPQIKLPNIKINKKKVIIDMLIMILVLSIAFGLFYFLTKDEPDTNEIKFVQEEKIEEKQEEVVLDNMNMNTKEAFSGKGSYECRTEDKKVRYFIKDSIIKIEKIDGTSKLIIKNNKTYTLNVKTGEWGESESKQGLAIPGSGIYPKIKLECEKIEVNEKEFNI